MTSLTEAVPRKQDIPKATIFRSSTFLRRKTEDRVSGLSWVAEGVAILRLSLVNVALVVDLEADGDRWVLVDAGFKTSAGRIREAANRMFGETPPSAIILTHGHFDHVGSALRLAQEWGIPIYAHAMELPFLTGISPYPPPDPVVGGMMSCLSRFFPRGPVDLGEWVQVLPADGSVPFLPQWRWVHTPGHTPGHISLFRESDRVLIAGDAFVTAKQESAISLLKIPPQVHRPPAYYTPDWPEAFRSFNVLKALDPEAAITGHGAAILGEDLRRGLEMVAEHWEGFVPARGRYVNEPAIMDECGLVHVPPRVTDVRLIAYSAVTAAAIVGGVLLIARKNRRPNSGRLDVLGRRLVRGIQTAARAGIDRFL